MEVFNNNNYYQAPIQQQQPYYNMPYYQPTEVYYPDYNTFAQPSDFNAPYQIYNYEKPIENTDYYMYAPQEDLNKTNETDSSQDIESILKSNEEVWQAYKTGKFKVKVLSEDGVKKIILKEKGSSLNESDYIIRKFKVLIARSSIRKSDDHVLLLSFSQKSLQNPSNQIVIRKRSGENSSHRLATQKSKSADVLSGPGTELINKIVNGEDSSEGDKDDNNEEEEEEDEEVSADDDEEAGMYEPAYHIQTSPSKTSSRQSKPKLSDSKSFSQKNSSSSDDEYLNEIIQKLKKSNVQESSVMSASRSQYSGETGSPQSRNTPYSQNLNQTEEKISRLSPASLGNIANQISASYMSGSRYSNGRESNVDTIKRQQSNSVLHYTLSDGRVSYVREETNSMGNVSRSSTRNVSVHEANHDTQSIGPGSMAGGSLFGGYIPTHINPQNISEFNYSKNGDEYTLREGDNKSGFSKSNVSRSNFSLKMEERSPNHSRIKL